jgi:transcriptional regulator with XRE-family HTH domain
MNYGQMIRTARKRLSLNQSDLANNKISRTLISEIEKGNTNLVTSKALLIYKKIIEESYLQKKDVQVDFDEILKDNFEYTQLRQVKEILMKLSQAEGESISNFDLENYRVFALRSEIGIFKYYIFRAIASNIKGDMAFKSKVLFNALDFLKWLNFEDIYKKYDETLKEVTTAAYKEGLFEELIHYYEYQKDGLIEIREFIEPRVYYNLFLFNEMIKKYEAAYRYLNAYLDYSTSLDQDDYHDALLGIPRLSTKAGDFEKGIKQYEDLLSRFVVDRYQKQRSIILSNILFNMPKLGTKMNVKKVEMYLEELISMLPEILEERDFPSELMVNIAIGYGLIGKKDEANAFVKKAFEYSTNSVLRRNVIIDAFNNIEKVDLELIVNNITKVELKALESKDSFMLVLLKLQKRLYEREAIEYKKRLDNYIDQI